MPIANRDWFLPSERRVKLELSRPGREGDSRALHAPSIASGARERTICVVGSACASLSVSTKLVVVLETLLVANSGTIR
jgi:hypothetical protein